MKKTPTENILRLSKCNCPYILLQHFLSVLRIRIQIRIQRIRIILPDPDPVQLPSPPHYLIVLQ